MALAVFLGSVLLIVSIAAEAAARDRLAADRWFVHTLDVLVATASLRQQLYQSGYIDADQGLRADARETGVLMSNLGRLSRLVGDNPTQVANVRQLKSALLLEGDYGAREPGRIRAAQEAKARLSRIEQEERSLLHIRGARTKAAQRQSANRRHLLFGVSGLAIALLMLTSLNANRAWRQASAAAAELRRLASTDELTGIANRRTFLETAERAVGGHGRYGRPLSMAIFDIDHFKQINDRYGHPVGDQAIKAVARIAQGSIRKADLVGRIGGEEFGLLLPELGEASAVEACERLRQEIERHAASCLPDDVARVTVSVGVAEAQEDSLDALINRADHALYAAKRAGRNRVASGV
ncbi:diguanylate cyclase [Sphingomonas sp.]|uniref:GGDEF domain-containing protein n=1 Tax=Sphingomonas sp. TaxID=28214 RepID=UPI003B3AD462